MKSDRSRKVPRSGNRAQPNLRARVTKIVLGLFGLSHLAAVHPATEQLAAAKFEIDQRVVAARAELKNGEAARRLNGDEASRTSPRYTAQWPNWTNWPNWPNWPNWSNWGNWFNQ